MLVASPKSQEVLSPLLGRARFEIILAWADADTRCEQPGFDSVEIGGLPESEINRVIGEIVTIMQVDQIVCPDITLLGGIVKVGDLVKVLAIVAEQRIIDRENAFGLHPSAR